MALHVCVLELRGRDKTFFLEWWRVGRLNSEPAPEASIYPSRKQKESEQKNHELRFPYACMCVIFGMCGRVESF